MTVALRLEQKLFQARNTYLLPEIKDYSLSFGAKTLSGQKYVLFARNQRLQPYFWSKNYFRLEMRTFCQKSKTIALLVEQKLFQARNKYFLPEIKDYSLTFGAKTLSGQKYVLFARNQRLQPYFWSKNSFRLEIRTFCQKSKTIALLLEQKLFQARNTYFLPEIKDYSLTFGTKNLSGQKYVLFPRDQRLQPYFWSKNSFRLEIRTFCQKSKTIALLLEQKLFQARNTCFLPEIKDYSLTFRAKTLSG